MPQDHTHGEPFAGLPLYPDGIEPSGAFAALAEAYRDERRALCLIVQDAVARAISDRTQGQVGLNRLLWREDEETCRWRLLAVAVTKAALGLAGSLREAGELWELDAETARELLAEHGRRMRHPQGWHEYREDAQAVASAVMRQTANCGDEPST